MSALARAGDACLGALALVTCETLAVIVEARVELAGPWEVTGAITRLIPIGWLAALPPALVGAALLQTSCFGKRGRVASSLAAALFSAWVAWGVSTGRHLEAPPLRAAFVLAVAASGAGLAYALAPRAAREMERRPHLTAAVAALAVVVLELANRLILHRLYEPFHTGLALATAALAGPVGAGLRPPAISRTEAPIRLALLGILAAVCAGRAARSLEPLSRADNLRMVFLDRAPVVGLGVMAAAAVQPPAPLVALAADPDREEASTRIDWTGWNLLLITVDALRADHVGAYGYARPTTPELDRLARSGALFEHAYCPTPHTSYSVTSLMTGKNLRPLLLQGLGADSDTWAQLLRRYGYRTAAFYPPAVFFIDADRFASFRDRQLDFEYARVEFASPDERADALDRYLARSDRDRRLFLWVHLFEPHEPYVAHAEHPFGDRDIDRYDSEIAAADAGIGRIVRLVRAARPRTIVLVAADHGEEFGDHGGRYHGTTVYEEQVRVPLVVEAPGLIPPRRVAAPVQTIDLLPTVLAALDIPRPARLRGHDLSRWLARGDAPAPGAPAERPAPPAFAETDEQTLLAEGPHRLVCLRRAAACALYDVGSDPGERRDQSGVLPAVAARMRSELATVQASHGRYETAGLSAEGGGFPPALRRAIAGDGDAAVEVASLLDDAEPRVRRMAAQVLFDLRRPESVAALRLAVTREEDGEARAVASLALARMSPDASRAMALLGDSNLEVRRRAALVLVEHGDHRGLPVLLEWWRGRDRVPFERVREMVEAFARARAPEAVPGLVRALDDVRLRVYAAAALGAIGQRAARGPLLERFAVERYQNARAALAGALAALGAGREMRPTLVRFLGTPDAIPGGLGLAAKAGILEEVGGAAGAPDGGAGVSWTATLRVAPGGNGSGCRALVRGRSTDGRSATVRLVFAGAQGATAADGTSEGALEPGPEPTEFARTLTLGSACAGRALSVEVRPSPNALVEAVAVVPLADELPPPPPEAWEPPDGGQLDPVADAAAPGP